MKTIYEEVVYIRSHMKLYEELYEVVQSYMKKYEVVSRSYVDMGSCGYDEERVLGIQQHCTGSLETNGKLHNIFPYYFEIFTYTILN